MEDNFFVFGSFAFTYFKQSLQETYFSNVENTRKQNYINIDSNSFHNAQNELKYQEKSSVWK